MNRITLLIVLLIFFVGCKKKQPPQNCIEYIDSLEINLDGNKLKTVLIDLAQENNIRPYSLFYDEHLIVLNKKGSFYAFWLDCFERDKIYESMLNTINFKKAFVAFDELYGVDSKNQAFKFDNIAHKWINLSYDLPFYNSASIYENKKYLCYSVCHGEFGGTVFFYNKSTEKITFVPATCVVSIMEFQDGGFYIVSNLAHLSGTSDIIKIENPDLLYEFPDSLNNRDKWDERFIYRPIIYSDTSIYNNQVIHIYDAWETLITAGFRIKEETYFLTEKYIEFQPKTFLSKLIDDSLVFINTPDTIFSNLPASHGEITRKLNDKTVIDYTFFADDPKEWKEVEHRNLLLTTFIITDSTLIRLNWKNR